MANRYAVASGNWSNPLIWDGGTLPSSGDTVRPNSYNVTINQDITVTELRNDDSSPIIAGGSFLVSTNRTINANITGGVALNGCLLFGANNLTVNINGNVNGGTLSQSFGIWFTGYNGITLNIVGNVTGGSGGIASGVHLSSASNIINITGDVRGVIGAGIQNVISTTKNFITVTGNVYGSSSSTSGYGVGGGVNTSADLTVYGNVYASVGAGVTCANAATMSNPIVKIYGIVYASNTVAGVYVTSSGSIWYTSAIDLNGIQAINNVGLRYLINTTSNLNTYTTSTNTVKSLYSAGYSTGHPSTENVRNGTVYGPSSELTGTLKVPTVENVRKGVLTDNTVGTAELTAQDLFNAITVSSDPIAERLRNVATVETTAGTVSAFSI